MTKANGIDPRWSNFNMVTFTNDFCWGDGEQRTVRLEAMKRFAEFHGLRLYDFSRAELGSHGYAAGVINVLGARAVVEIVNSDAGYVGVTLTVFQVGTTYSSTGMILRTHTPSYSDIIEKLKADPDVAEQDVPELARSLYNAARLSHFMTEVSVLKAETESVRINAKRAE